MIEGLRTSFDFHVYNLTSLLPKYHQSSSTATRSGLPSQPLHQYSSLHRRQFHPKMYFSSPKIVGVAHTIGEA